MPDTQLRQTLIETCRAMNNIGLNQGTSGNVSVRLPEGRGLLISPSAMEYHDMIEADVVRLALDGRVLEGQRQPSSEWPFHTAILRDRADVGAVVHVHSPFATALACLGEGIPAFHYMVAVAGGRDIRCSPYALFGTEALSEHVLRALEGRKACLMANHGMIALGDDLDGALALAVEVEALARQYVTARQAGEPHLLSDAEMAAVIEKFKDYKSTW